MRYKVNGVDGIEFEGSVDGLRKTLTTDESISIGLVIEPNPEDLRKDAANRLESFKANTRAEAVPIPDPLHRDALFLKGETYLLAAVIEDPEYFKAHYLPIIQQAAAAEAALRGLNEDPADLRKASINKLLPLLGITCLIEGFGKKLELGLKDLPPEQIPAFLDSAEQQANAMKAETLGGTDVTV